MKVSPPEMVHFQDDRFSLRKTNDFKMSVTNVLKHLEPKWCVRGDPKKTKRNDKVCFLKC